MASLVAGAKLSPTDVKKMRLSEMLFWIERLNKWTKHNN